MYRSYTRSFKGISEEGAREKVLEQSGTLAKDGIVRMKFLLPRGGHYIIEAASTDAKDRPPLRLLHSGRQSSLISIALPIQNLNLKPGRDLYSVGDTAEVLIMTPVSGGTVLVTLEGNRILKYETVSLKGNTAKYRIKITPEMSPNFTIAAVQFSAGKVYKNEIRLSLRRRKNFCA